MKSIAIIGAAFGDEGKGRIVDHFAAKSPDGIVVRFNGGAQAAHTVQVGSTRYVFHHFGSGSAAGLPTYLSQYFLVNPLLWKTEYDTLPFKPKAFVSPDAIVTTPYDMFINREAETQRGGKRHGSCGHGINETVERHLAGRSFRLKAHELQAREHVRGVLHKIRDEWVPQRFKALGLTKVSDETSNWISSGTFVEAFLDAGQQFLGATPPMSARDLGRYATVIFEGAQGLLLDQDSEFFPHVTRSSTGLANIRRLLSRDPDEVVYVMRAYMTRHGAGPLPTESKAMSFEDKTNVSNAFQGTLRFGILDLDLISKAIAKDGAKLYSLAITCLDQVDDRVRYRWHNNVCECSRDELPERVKRILRAQHAYVSTGPARSGT